ncbi:MAG TPA: amylo-alpha-1,6-glucosidase [Syntrophales bacterium]|nr:amylo-alpha-1,6-glucosidase [Syntrophales bacterium]
MIRYKFDETTCLNLEKALSLEWLETNGLGSYASSTILSCNTRKYHGLLVANLKKPQGRHSLLSWLEDSLVMKGKEFFLSCCQYPGVFHPGEKHFLKEYRLDYSPRFIYEAEGFHIHKAIMMVHGEDRILIRYDVEHCRFPGILRLKPFLAYRGFHALAKQNVYLRTDTHRIDNGFRMRPYDGMPPMFIQTDMKSEFHPSPVWYNNFEYRVEKERGFEWHEDLFRPGIFEVPVKEGSTIIISASPEICRRGLEEAWKAEMTRRAGESATDEKAVEKFHNEEDRINVRNLAAAGRQFLIKTPTGRPAIIAGYHWFGDWGRDTLISLPGLTFCNGRIQEGTAILASLGAHEKKGLLPNYFSDGEAENAYNTVDTSLWYFWGVQQMLKRTGDIEIVRNQMWPVMKKILQAYMDGTAYNIGMSKNGLLHAGDKDTQLTWMDASVEGKPVTPRWGYPVEINALWYNAICFAHELAQAFDDNKSFLHVLIPEIKKSFVDAFWIEDGAYLGDVFCEGSLDRTVRPNQILAVSLPHSPLDFAQQAGVVHKVMQHLLTPVGLRTLTPEDENYKGRYEGDGPARDLAYHQGAVWPWLMAHFGEAYIKVAVNRAAAKTFLLEYVRSFVRQHMPEAGVGCISEIFDGDPPHRPNGCISQAWSVAGLLRLYSFLNEIPDS